MFIMRIILIILQVRPWCHNIADYVWQDKRAASAQSVDNLGYPFRPAMRAGWLKYICNACSEGAVMAGPAVEGDTLAIPD
jgi:hypothetical protein